MHLDLPGQLGADISQTANGFTYSQSQRGHTIFTIHASKIVQFKGDEAELHDVAITLYGPEGSHREDKIAGNDFSYNKKTGVVVANGAVSIDMASPTARSTGANSAANSSPDRIHVDTVGLRFDQASGEAQTDGPLAFTLPRASGRAIGGDYNSKTGVLVLQKAVELHVVTDAAAPGANGPTGLTNSAAPADSTVLAEHAQLLRDSHVAFLLKARADYDGGRGSADQVIVHFRPDGSIGHIDAEDHVRMTTVDGAQLSATNAAADFDGKSQPLNARAGGGVNFLSSTPLSNMHGNAVEGTMLFATGADGRASLRHADFRNAVSFVLEQKSFAGDVRGSASREMTATKLDVDFAPDAAGRSLARRAVAEGGAMVNLHDLPYGAPQRHTAIYGQQLVASLQNGHELQELDGSGGTKVVDYAPDGATDTSSGDQLLVTFLPVTRTAVAHPSDRATAGVPIQSAVIDTAVQTGRVAMVAQPAHDAKTSDGSPQQPLYADAAKGTYHAADGTLRLWGDAQHPPRVHNDTLALTATEVDYRPDSGDATAQGDVRSISVRQPGAKAGPVGLGGSGPVHVVAAVARMNRDSNVTVFDGDAGRPARMWQGPDSLTAPVLELAKGGGSLKAHGADGAHAAVHAVLADQVGGGGRASGGETRVSSDTFFYSDRTHTGDFRGGVVAEQPNGVVHADGAQVFLSAAGPDGSSRLDRVVATGRVVLLQPGRRGTGQKLVYTAGDGNYLLTGTPGEPPRASDTARGTITGAALLFRSGDNEVEVLNSDAEGNNRRTVTDTRSPR